MATTFRDYYEVLGVPRTATAKEIHQAFRKLARKHHPDVNPNDSSAAEKFKEINEAHEVLGDPDKRRKYDELGPDWEHYEEWVKAGRPPRGGGASQGQRQYRTRTVSPEDLEDLFGGGEPFSDFFQSMFGGTGGGRTRTSRSRRGEDVEGETPISLEEAYRGTTRTIELSSPTGTRRVEVRIPAGIKDGAKVRAAGQGGPGQGGGTAGDLFVRVRIEPHSVFRRQGDDIHTKVAVPLDVALLGGEVPVRTLKGSTVMLNVPAGTQNGARLRLRGLGMPRLRHGGHGDVIAEVDVRLPSPVPDDLRSAAEALRTSRSHVPA